MNKLYFQSYLETAPEIITELYSQVSYLEKSIPGAGSPCYNSSDLHFNRMGKVIRVIKHKQTMAGQCFTVQTDKGFFKFWPDLRKSELTAGQKQALNEQCRLARYYGDRTFGHLSA